MAGSYVANIGNALPYRVRCSVDQLAGLVTLFSMPRDDAPNGSSFAVTSDAPSGYRFVWMSEVSYQTFIRTYPFFSLQEGTVTKVGKE